MKRLGVILLVAALALAAGTGCRRVRLAESERTQVDVVHTDIDGARRAEVALKMGAGELAVASKNGSDTLMDAEFTTSYVWRPTVEYAVTGTEGRLVVTQPSDPSPGFKVRNYVNEWDIALAEHVPIDMQVETGAGECTLDLAGLDLTSLRVNVGAGESRIELPAVYDHDLRVEVQAGIGETTLRLPSDVGVRVVAQAGLGGFDAEGFTIENGAYVNDAYGHTAHSIEVQVQHGVGQVNLELAR